MTVEQLTSKFELTHTHTLVSQSDNFVFRKVGASDKSASVYVWVACKSDGEFKVLYVGKAGKGVHLRCNQHMGGFVNSGTGRKNATELKRYLSDGHEVRVYARQSSVMEIFGQVVSLYSAEEDALCAVLNPILNRAVFPSVDARTEKGPSVAGSTQSVASADLIGQLINSRLVQSTTVSTDDLSAQLDAYTEDQRLSVGKLLTYINNQLLPEHRAKLVGGYAGHPKGCNGETTLTYAIPGPSGQMKRGSWQVRVYFGAQPRAGFPLARLKSTAHDKVDVSEQEKTFSPKSTADFIKNPAKYLV